MNVKILKNQVRSSLDIIRGYSAGQPFHLYLQQYFRNHRKYGSKDRKNIRELTYLWFRIGRTIPTEPEKALLLVFLLFKREHDAFGEEWNESFPEEVFHWLSHQYPSWNYKEIFPDPEAISSSIDKENFILSHVQQPLLWIWTPHRDEVKRHLEDLGIALKFNDEAPNAIGLPNGFNLDELPDKWKNQIVVQDLSSQVICRNIGVNKEELIWDCCAASGGKSLNLLNNHNELNLYVSDIRSNILHNLKHRFAAFRFKKYFAGLADLSKASKFIQFNFNPPYEAVAGAEYFDTILLDAPCSGSGTWSRNPEGLIPAENEIFKRFQNLQKSILRNVWPFLKKGGTLYYITCSVYEAENEAVVSSLESTEAEILSSQYFQGHWAQSDSMFYAVLRKK